MNPLNKIRTLTYTTLTILLTTICLIPLASATTTSTFTVAASTNQIIIDLPQGTIFNSTITTSGTIRVWASDVNGSLVSNLGLVDNSGKLNFVATKGGIYTINFENNVANSATVTFSYQTDPELSTGNTSVLPITYLPVFIAITVVGCIVIIYLSRKNRKNHTNDSEQ